MLSLQSITNNDFKSEPKAKNEAVEFSMSVV